MDIYLPIAELPVNIILLLFLGGTAGILSGIFGIGGGFLLTPLLIFIGVPPPVAVATSANQIIAASFSGFLAHWRRMNVDIKMGILLLVGGFIGSTLGVWIFAALKSAGQLDLVISLIYVLFLGFVGTLMGIESFRTISKIRRGITITHNRGKWVKSLPLPWQTYFPRSDMSMSALLPIVIGIASGILVSLMGIGGGFVMIPAMIYLLGMPTNMVVGTSLFQTIFTTANVTLLHAIGTHSVDVVLAVILIFGAVIGAQIGTRISMRMPAEKLRGLLALIVLLVCLKLALGLLIEPDNLYNIEEIIGR